MSEKENKATHFANIEDLISSCKDWIYEEDGNAFYRWFDFEAMEDLINLIEKQQTRIDELEKALVEEDLKQQTKIKELEADLYSANCTINEYIEERNKLKDKLKEHKKDLDYEPWSIYKIDGKVLFDLVNIMGE